MQARKEIEPRELELQDLEEHQERGLQLELDEHRERELHLELENQVNENKPPEPKVVNLSGTFLDAYMVDTLVAHCLRSAAISFITPVNAMVNLKPLFKDLLIISPLLPNLLNLIPMTLRVNKNGGKKEGLVMMGLAFSGMTALTILFGCTDIKTIETFDWRYGIILGSGLLIGNGSGATQLVSDALKWTPKKKYIPNLQLLYSFLVDLSSVSTPIVMFYTSKWGYYIPFSVYTGLILLGGMTTLGFVHPSPYHQFKTKLPHEEAKKLAIAAGELEEFIQNYDETTLLDMVKENVTVLFDRRALLLGFSVFASLGSFFVSKTILPNILINGYGLSPANAVVTSALASLVTISTRPPTAKFIEHFEKKSGGVLAHMVGSSLAIGGTIPLAVGSLPPWAVYLSLGISSVGFGINLVTPLSIASAWSQPEEGATLKPVNPATMFSLFGTIGSLGGILLPLLLGGLVEGGGTSWYQHYFFIIMTLMLVSAIGVPIVNYQVKRKKDESIFKSALTFFGRPYQSDAPQPQVRSIVEVLDEDIEAQTIEEVVRTEPQERNDIHVTAIL